MRLQIANPAGSRVHKEVVSAVGWNAFNELYSCSDDKTVCKWDISGDAGGKVCDLETYVTDMQWFPGANKNAAGNDVYVVSCTDGSFKICQRNGRVEKSVDAHRGGT